MSNQYVVPNKNGGWSVKAKKSKKSTINTKTQKEAIEIAKNQEAELIILGRDGKTRNKNTYKKIDPFPPRDNVH